MYDPKSKRQFCDRLMSHFEADMRNDQFRMKGRSTRWIPKEDIPKDADDSLVGLGVWKEMQPA
jgi:hypothetical protein